MIPNIHSVSQAVYPEIDRIFQQISFVEMHKVFPKFLSQQDGLDFKVIPTWVASYGRAIAWINVSNKVIYFSTKHLHSAMTWNGRDIKVSETQLLDGVLRHELAHLVQSRCPYPMDTNTHTSESWFFVVSEWCRRTYGKDSFLDVEELLNIMTFLRNNKKSDKDDRKDFVQLMRGYRFNYSKRQVLAQRDFCRRILLRNPQAHGNKFKKQPLLQKICAYCGTSFLGNPRGKYCKSSCRTMACIKPK